MKLVLRQALTLLPLAIFLLEYRTSFQTTSTPSSVSIARKAASIPGTSRVTYEERGEANWMSSCGSIHWPNQLPGHKGEGKREEEEDREEEDLTDFGASQLNEV